MAFLSASGTAGLAGGRALFLTALGGLGAAVLVMAGFLVNQVSSFDLQGVGGVVHASVAFIAIDPVSLKIDRLRNFQSALDARK
jgi:hypothetical protein